MEHGVLGRFGTTNSGTTGHRISQEIRMIQMAAPEKRRGSIGDIKYNTVVFDFECDPFPGIYS